MTLLVTVIDPTTGTSGQITAPEPVVLVASTSLTYTDTGELFSGPTAPAGATIGFIVVQPPNWSGNVTLGDNRFAVKRGAASVHAVTTAVALPVNTTYTMTASTDP